MAGKKINFLVDTGATYSVLNSYARPLLSSSTNIMGVEGKSQTCFYIFYHLSVEIQMFKTFFPNYSAVYYTTRYSILIWLGQDLLARLGAILKFQEVPVKTLKIMPIKENKKQHPRTNFTESRSFSLELWSSWKTQDC